MLDCSLGLAELGNIIFQFFYFQHLCQFLLAVRIFSSSQGVIMKLKNKRSQKCFKMRAKVGQWHVSSYLRTVQPPKPRFSPLSRSRQPFWSPLRAILNFAGSAELVALQVVSECPFHRQVGISFFQTQKDYMSCLSFLSQKRQDTTLVASGAIA